ncbi:ABC transporter permease [Brevibacterium album]|uniref:ABC transporter permease n=1 Tax=Brevibacterium album TaxID=417948 RepID=UPI0006842CD6|nr:ABC transporter permease subunit [Brevibacterium album]
MTTSPRLTTTLTFVVLAIALVPVPVLIWTSVFGQTYLTVPPESYSLEWYLNLDRQRQLFDGLLLSLGLAVVAAVISTCIGTATAIAIRKSAIKKNAAGLESLMTLPLTIPTIVSSMALFITMTSLGRMLNMPITGTFGLLLAAHVVVTLPWTFRIMSAGAHGLNMDIERASLDLGYSRAATFFKVTLPSLRSSLGAAGILAFIVSFADLEMSLFLVAPGSTTLPVAMVQYAETRVDPALSAFAVVQLLIVMLLIVVANSVLGFSKKFAGGIKG